MSNYPIHPNATHPPTMTCEIPLEEYESLKRENAELKAHIEDLEKLNHDLCERVTENDEIRLHWEEIEQTRTENERLKAKLENVQASMYADAVDLGMENRRLKRALWLARAKDAWSNARWFNLCNPDYVRNRQGFTPNNETQKQMNSIEWARLFYNNYKKLIAKAKEYK